MDTAEFIRNFVINFTAIVWEALPFIVLGAIIAGILEEVLPQQAIARILPKKVLPAVMIGGALGLVFPMCECGIVVVMRRLLRKGLPLSSCVAYMLAGPIVNVVVIMSTYTAFYKHMVQTNPESGFDQSLGIPMVLLRVGLGFFIAVTTGLVVYFLEKRTKTPLLTALANPPAPKKSKLSLNVVDEPEPPEPKKPLMRRLNNISTTALHDFMDIMVFLILGSAIAALVKSNPDMIRQVEELSRTSPLLAIPAMMGLAVLLCLCSEADAFLAASFTGMSISARTAFLVLGPMLDLKLLLMYTRVFRAKLILTIVLCTVSQTLILSTALHFVYNPRTQGEALSEGK